MQQPRPTSRAWVALGLVLVVVLLFVVFFVALSAAGPSSRAAADQCDRPVSERTGGWVCP